MPWQKSFDRDEVLDEAMALFWERGYRGVSMGDLVATLGVSRSSLYSTYGHKEQLFQQALVRYDRIHRQDWLEALAARLDPIESIRQAFVDVTAAPEPSRWLGCLLVNTTLELPSEAPFAGEVIERAFGSTEQFFERQLAQAQDDHQLPADIDVASLAATLTAMLLGIRVLARARRPSDAIEPVLRQVDSLLGAA